jgi:hypothetical protein
MRLALFRKWSRSSPLSRKPLALTPAERTPRPPPLDDAIRRAARAAKDAAMLGDSGYERIEADAYFTPPENVDCLSQFVDLAQAHLGAGLRSGNITLRLKEFGHEVISSDLHDYGFEEQIGTFDFLAADAMPDGFGRSSPTRPTAIWSRSSSATASS